MNHAGGLQKHCELALPDWLGPFLADWRQPLDTDERRIMESHPVLGVKSLLANGEPGSAVISAAWGHHIRQDGGGYPKMPEGYVNSTAAALIHVFDVFEALTATRPYKLPLPPRRAYEIMLADRGTFDPVLLGALVNSMGLYPPGSEIMLSDFRRAVVVAPGTDPEYPRVRVTHECGGLPLPGSAQPALQLQAGSGPQVKEFLTVGLQEESEGETDIQTVGTFG